MKIAVAQTRPSKGDILTNIGKHQQLIHLAASAAATAIFFPELSITGYEPELAAALATSPADQRFDGLQQMSNTYNITIGLGMPIKTHTGVQIGMVIFRPGKPRQTYAKQQLHPDELPYFINGTKQTILAVGHTKIAPAICYESLQLTHAHQASKLGAEIYVVSVAKSENGVNKAMHHYPKVAKQYAMPVLMANSVGFCDNFNSAGKSAVWTKAGILIAQLDQESEGLLIFDTNTEEVFTHVI